MAAEVVKTAKLKPEPAYRAAAESWVVATDLAEALARAGVPFHQGHQVVGKLVLKSVNENIAPGDWRAEELVKLDARITPAIAVELVRLMDPREGMQTRTSPGGTAPATVAAAFEAAAERLKEMAS